MNRNHSKGVSIIEFALLLSVFLLPLLIGMFVIGFNELRALEVTQLARDAGSLFARNIPNCDKPSCGMVDFSSASGKSILKKIAGDLDLRETAGALGSADAGSAVVILSALTRMDTAACQNALRNRIPPPTTDPVTGRVSGCTNQNQWVFLQRVVVGNNALQLSNYGGPLAANSVLVLNTQTGVTFEESRATDSSLVARFTGINPYDTGTQMGIPAGRAIFIAEAGTKPLALPGFIDEDMSIYSFSIF